MQIQFPILTIQFLTNTQPKNNSYPMISCPKCLQTEKRLKITISDYEFELKKIQEDKSTDKAMYEIHLLKEVKRWQEMYNREKGQREDQVRNWMEKYDGMRGKYEDEITGLRERHCRELGERVEAVVKESQAKIDRLTADYENKLQSLATTSQSKIKSLQDETQTKLAQLSTQHESTILSLKKHHKITIDQKAKSFESRLLGAESQKIKEQKMHEETKNESKETIAKLYQSIYGLRKNVSGLEEKLKEQIEETVFRQETIQRLNQKILTLKHDHQTDIAAIRAEHKTELEQIRQNFKQKLAILYQENLDYCSKYQTAIEKIQESRENQKTMYLNNIEEINTFVENRASRPEDIEQIDLLREALMRKTKQCDTLADELKFFRLELENKQETYNRIFVPIANPSNETVLYKRKEFKLRRQGKSVTTVREALQSLNSASNVGDKKFPPKMRIV